MSVVGIDFGNANNVVSLARRKGIDVVLNSESKRETPCMVNFGEKQVRAPIGHPSPSVPLFHWLVKRGDAALSMRTNFQSSSSFS
jgi:molecular chaperone DnaK (HSP70)